MNCKIHNIHSVKETKSISLMSYETTVASIYTIFLQKHVEIGITTKYAKDNFCPKCLNLLFYFKNMKSNLLVVQQK